MAFQPFGSVFEQQVEGRQSDGINVAKAFPEAPTAYGLKPGKMSEQPALLRAPHRAGLTPQGDAMPQPTGNEGAVPDLLARVASLEARVQQLEIACGHKYNGSSSDKDVGLKIIESPYMNDGEMP